MTTQSIVKKIFNNFGASKATQKNHFKESATLEIERIRARQEKCHAEYSQAGFEPTNITAMIVQRQLAMGA